MKLHMPHPRRHAQQRREAQQASIRQAVRRARLADRTPQTRDPLAEARERQERRRVR